MKYKDIQAMSDDELAKKLEEGRSELFNLRFQMATSQLDNTARVKTVKKDIARVLTEQRARQFQMATSQLDNTARVKTVKKDIARVQTEQRARQIAAEKSAAQN